MPPPARDAVRAEHPHQRQFRVLVPASADARHHIAALRFGKDIGHGILLARSSLECTRIPADRGCVHGTSRSASESPRVRIESTSRLFSPAAAGPADTAAVLYNPVFLKSLLPFS